MTTLSPLFSENQSDPFENATLSLMAVVGTPNRTCASQEILDLYRSNIYIGSIIFNCLVPFVSFYVMFKAMFRLCTQSIIQHTTRILLISTILFGLSHQVSYLLYKADLLHTMLFRLSDPCNLQRTSYECRFIAIAQTTGNCGMAFTQIAMSIDRALNLKFPKSYFKMKSWPGIVLASAAFIASFSMYFFLTIDDPLTGYQNHCGFYPTNSVRYFNILLYVILGIAVSNAIADFVLLKLAKQEIMWKRSYDFTRRFNARISLKCSKAIFVISMCEGVSNMIYSGVLTFLMYLGKSMSTSTYSLILAWFYTTPYACCLLPFLISYLLVYIKDQTTIGVLSLTSKQHSTEEHIARLKQAWS